MGTTRFIATRSGPAVFPRRAGITLLEVLAAIFILGVGLLALLVLFPIGALSMARAIQDDRAAQVAADAATFSADGEALLSQTGQFVVVSLVTGSADPKNATTLRKAHEALAIRAADLDNRIRELRPLAPNAKVRKQVDRLLVQIRIIKQSLDALAGLLQEIEGGL